MISLNIGLFSFLVLLTVALNVLDLLLVVTLRRRLDVQTARAATAEAQLPQAYQQGRTDATVVNVEAVLSALESIATAREKGIRSGAPGAVVDIHMPEGWGQVEVDRFAAALGNIGSMTPDASIPKPPPPPERPN